MSDIGVGTWCERGRGTTHSGEYRSLISRSPWLLTSDDVTSTARGMRRGCDRRYTCTLTRLARSTTTASTRPDVVDRHHQVVDPGSRGVTL
jgi:hypothetical protein